MFHGLLSGGNRAEKGLSFATATVDEILSREDLVEYLRIQSEQTFANRNLILFVERHLSKIVLAIQKSGTPPAVAGGGSGATAGRPGAKATAASLPRGDRSGSVSSSDDSTANGSPNSSPNSSIAAMPPHHANVTPMAALHIENATELLTQYIRSSDSETKIEKIVPSSITALGKKGVLHPLVAQSVQRILLAAFDEDFVKTNKMISVALDEEIIHGAIRNISFSVVIAETIIAIFGSALTAVSMMAATTQTHTFTQSWIQMDFPRHLASYITVAMSTTDNLPYFFFLREVLRRGFSHSAGPVVDVMLSEGVVVGMIHDVIDACEVTDGSNDVFPLAADAVGVLVSMVCLIRKSLIPSESREMYRSNLSLIAPIQCIKKHSKRLCALLFKDDIVKNAVASNGLGACRFGICELFTELLNYHMYETDMLIVDSGFLDALARTCERFPQHDGIARLLMRAVLMVFERRLMIGETAQAALQHDAIVRFLAEQERLAGAAPDSSSSSSDDDGDEKSDGDGGGEPKGKAVGDATTSARSGEVHAGVSGADRTEGVPGSDAAPGSLKTLFTHLAEFCISDAYKNTSLQAFALETVSKLLATPLFSPTSMVDSPFKTILSKILQNSEVELRLNNMRKPITGDAFSQPKSGCGETISHRPLKNYTDCSPSANGGKVSSPSTVGSTRSANVFPHMKSTSLEDDDEFDHDSDELASPYGVVYPCDDDDEDLGNRYHTKPAQADARWLPSDDSDGTASNDSSTSSGSGDSDEEEGQVGAAGEGSAAANEIRETGRESSIPKARLTSSAPMGERSTKPTTEASAAADSSKHANAPRDTRAGDTSRTKGGGGDVEDNATNPDSVLSVTVPDESSETASAWSLASTPPRSSFPHLKDMGLPTFSSSALDPVAERAVTAASEPGSAGEAPVPHEGGQGEMEPEDGSDISDISTGSAKSLDTSVDENGAVGEPICTTAVDSVDHESCSNPDGAVEPGAQPQNTSTGSEGENWVRDAIEAVDHALSDNQPL